MIKSVSRSPSQKLEAPAPGSQYYRRNFSTSVRRCNLQSAVFSRLIKYYFTSYFGFMLRLLDSLFLIVAVGCIIGRRSNTDPNAEISAVLFVDGWTAI